MITSGQPFGYSEPIPCYSCGRYVQCRDRWEPIPKPSENENGDIEKHTMRFEKGNKIKYGKDFRFYEGIPSGIDFVVKHLEGDKFDLSAYGYGQMEPHDEHSYGNGSLFVYDLTDEQIEQFKKHAINKIPERAFL
jgi:hypothetical protein